mmetsp:Transcript_9584/g.15726  ORF Transcript_9584/g.15726 Transcript_9584/m.15726 type:complete len:158 (-) Transcript_9584:600-1073(-)
MLGRLASKLRVRPLSRGLSTADQGQELSGWRKHAYRFREKPASHIVSFALLHEITAVVPIGLVYLALDASERAIPLPEGAIEEGNRFVSKVRAKLGLEPLPPDSRALFNAAAAYMVVKFCMPVRLAACFALTPWFARAVVTPSSNALKRTLGYFPKP